MGIADFGVTGATPGATAYAYSTPSFEGQAVVRSLAVTLAGTSSKVTAFELNAVVVLQRNGTNYSYWIQNGLHLDASSDEFTIGGAYVWNFSSPSATLSAGELVGNTGSVLVSDRYYDIPGCGPTYPGQCSTRTLPSTLTGRIVTSTSGGLPFVAYQYNLGSGWVTYDNVSFAHMGNASDAGFHVDGFSETPYAAGLYYDAEWVWVGAGGGSVSTDQGSDIDLTLSEWNGHDYQAIPTAWDFGSNTGERSTNVTESATSAPGGHVASGAGSLGILYNLTNVGFLNLVTPARGGGTVLVDGRATSFQGGWANLTLPVGSHSLYLENYTNASHGFSIVAGTSTLVNLSAAGALTFSESGLPASTAWGINVSGTAHVTTALNLTVNLANGTYPVAYLPVPGYELVGPHPESVFLPGTAPVALAYAPFTYPVNVSETGLPTATPWWINVSGTLIQSTGTSVPLTAPNGSTPFTVGSAYEFLANPESGAIVITAGILSPVTISFSYRPTFIEGTVVPAGANLSIGGVPQTLSSGTFDDPVLPGSYTLLASAPGYASSQITVAATPGNVSWENITLVANQTPSGPSSPSTSGAGLSLVDTAAIVGAVVVVALVAVVALLRRRT